MTTTSVKKRRLPLILFCLMAVAPLVAGAVSGRSPASNNFAEENNLQYIRFIGVNSLDTQRLEQELPLRLGAPWKPGQQDAAVMALEAYYRLRGFYQVRVAADISRTPQGIELTLKVDEGRPCYITSIGVADPTGIDGKRNTDRFKERILQILGVEVGARYDEEFVTERTRKLREFLIQEDYVQVKTDQVHLVFNEGHTGVSVDFQVFYGDRVTFGFSGNSVFSKGELTDMIQELKIADLGQDYVGTISRKIQERYKALAYEDIRVKPEYFDTRKGKRVVFDIQEGERFNLHQFQIYGLSPENEKGARGVFESQVSRLVQRGFFVEKEVERGLQLILDDLRSRGYLASKILSRTFKRVPGLPQIEVKVQFQEGDQTAVDSVEFDGFQALSREKLLESLGLSEDAPFNPFRAEEGLQKIKRLYRDLGYLDFQFHGTIDQISTYTDNNRRVHLSIKATEGRRYRWGRVRLEGLRKTKEYVVLREVEVNQGEFWTSENVGQVETGLQRTGLFAEVRVRPEPSELGEEFRDAVIELKESDPGLVELGPGFRSDLGVRFFAQAGYTNLFGRNKAISLYGATNRRIENFRFLEYNVQTTFLEPRLLGSRFAVSSGLSTAKRQYIDFNAVQTQFFASLDRKLHRRLLARMTYRLERVRQFGAENAVDNQSLLIGSMTPSLTLDLRDNPFVVTKGYLGTLSLEYALPLFAGLTGRYDSASVGYYKLISSHHFYIPLFSGWVFSNVVSGGFSQALIEKPIPLIKTFRLGGFNTIRGFREDGVNHDDKLVRNQSFVNLRSQIDVPLIGEFKFSPFIDAGNVFLDAIRGDPFLRVGAGAGFRYVTPIGPVNFDYGVNLNRRAHEDVGRFHFSVGVI